MIAAAASWLWFARAPRPVERAVSDGGASQHVRSRNGRAAVTTRASSGIAGCVHDGERAVANARVCASCVACEATRAPAAPCTRSLADGRYAFADLPAGGYFVAASAEGFAPASARDGAPVYLAAGQSLSDVDVALSRGGARVRGSVVDATGGPIAHARVRALRLTPPRLSLDLESDAQGHFELWVEPGFIELSATAEGYARASQRTTAPTEVELRLVPGASVAGVVVRAGSGEPIAGVDVRAAPPENPQLAMAEGAISDAEGRFVVDGLEPGAYLLRARAEGLLGAPLQVLELGVAEQRSGIVVEMTPAAEVSGRVSIADDRGPCRQGVVALGPPSPVQPAPSARELARAGVTPEALAHALGPEQVADIEADGSVHFAAVPPALYFVNVQCASHVLSDGPRLLRVGDRALDALEWKVSAGAQLGVQVLDERGRPLPEVDVVLEHPSSASHVISSHESDAQGRVELDGLAPGTYRAYAGGQEASAVTIELRADRKREATLRLAGSASITVELADERGQPLDGLSVHAAEESDASASPARARRRHMALPLGAGRYRLGPLSAGHYAIGADDGINPPLAASAPPTMVPLAAGEQVRTRIVLARGGAIRGIVVDEHQAAVADVWVSVKPQLDPSSGSTLHSTVLAERRPLRVLSDGDGRFTISNLSPTARFDLRVLEPYGSAAVLRGVTPGADVVVVLPQPGSISGVALDEAGQPVRALRVSAVSRDAQSRQTRTFFDPQGRFSLPRVAPGAVELALASADGRSAQLSLELAAGQRLDGVSAKLESIPEPQASEPQP